jgi:cyclophilin family peptidyl-prolyl cis-trans isomerase
MSTSDSDNAAQIEQLLKEAETTAAAENWDRTIEIYRQVLAFDRGIQGAEAKLQWALRMKDIETNYQQGKAHLEAKRYNEALAALRKARLMYASHYKDTDQLIVEAQSVMQKENWQARPVTSQKKGCALLGGALVAILLIALLSACASPTPAPTASSPKIPTAGTAPTVASAVNPSSGTAGKLSAQQRSNIYKAAPAISIDVNKKYTATIKTSKGNIVLDLYAKDAPQHVNNFVFLARDGFFDGLTFHRVVAGFVIQGGDPLGTGVGGPGYNIPPEIKAKHTEGALAMARQGGPAQTTPSSGSQFYITLAPQPSLDGEYTVFGQTTSGMDVVKKIAIGDKIESVTITETAQ